MGIRAVYTFIDQQYRHSVYKHWDGYPHSGWQFIANAVALARPLLSWPLTRSKPATSIWRFEELIEHAVEPELLPKRMAPFTVIQGGKA